MKILIGLIIGFIIGYIFACACEVYVENGYIKTGIAKLHGEYYSIEKIEKRSDKS